MIAGSVYLGKKAQKAYHNHKAEKAAQKLKAPYDIADPSNEITSGIPPSSQTDSTTTSPLFSATPPNLLSELPAHSPTSNLSPSSSTASQGKSIEEQEFNHYVQRQSEAENPPSYDVAISSPMSASQQTFTAQSHSPSIPQSQYTIPSTPLTPQSIQTSPTITDRFLRGCETCIIMMETFQKIYPHPHQLSPVQQRPSSQQNPSSIAEMPDQSVYTLQPVPQRTGPILEAPDTGAYDSTLAMSTSMSFRSGPVPVELPADMPERDRSVLEREGNEVLKSIELESDEVLKVEKLNTEA